MVDSDRKFKCHACKVLIPGTNCAYELSYQMGWKKKPGCTNFCSCGYPVRAKDIRSNLFSSYIDNDRKATSNAFIYCENNAGNGHVYYGTFNNCVKGNGLAASGMSSVNVFERYGSHK